MRKHFKAMAMFLACTLGLYAQGTDTETHRQYLSGTGCDDMVEWDFYCTDGRNSGIWTKIGVPSCWELQGFGTYQYGMRFYGKATPEGIANEKGKYKYEFTLPKEWQGRQILLVFEAAFTDLKATIIEQGCQDREVMREIAAQAVRDKLNECQNELAAQKAQNNLTAQLQNQTLYLISQLKTTAAAGA